MRITVFTSNQSRHLHLLSILSGVADVCYAVVESNTVFPGRINDFYKKSKVMQDYFINVLAAENKYFGNISFLPDNIHPLVIKMGDLNYLSKDILESSLHSDLYVVFGASYIKGWLAEYLISKKAINIHIGTSPYYRGSSCNFWALYDSNPHLVGSTIHLLSSGIDNGPILYHALPKLIDESPFEFTMKSVYAAHISLAKKIDDGSIFDMEPINQDPQSQIRYSKNSDFTDSIVNEYLSRDLTNLVTKELISKKMTKDLFIKPVFI